MLASGQLPVVQALELGESIAAFSLHQKYHDLELLSEWAAAELEASLRHVRKQIYALAKVTKKRVLEHGRWVLKCRVMPLALSLEGRDERDYSDEQRAADVADYDKSVAVQLEKLRELRREERRLVKLRDWANQRHEQIFATVNPLADWLEEGTDSR